MEQQDTIAQEIAPQVPTEQQVEAPPQPQEEGALSSAPNPLSESDQNVEAPKEQKDQAQWYAADRAAFDNAYPDVDKEALFADDDFCDYAVGKVGVWPLADIYRGYKRMQSRFAREGQVMAARASNPGSLRQTAADGEGEYYTLQQMQSMSPAYIEAHWDKVQQSIKHLGN